MSEKQYDDEMRFALFANDKATPENRQPQSRGWLQVNGVRYKLSGWTRTTQAGKRMVSGRVEPDEERPAQQHDGAGDEEGPF